MQEFYTWFDERSDKCLDLGLCYQDYRLPIEPMTISKKWLDCLSTDLLLLASLSRKTSLKHFLNQNTLFRHDQSGLIRKYINHERVPVIMRPDGIVVDNQLKIIDLNVDSAIGGV